MRAPAFKRSEDTNLIVQALGLVEIGATISYAALSEAIGKSVTGATPALQSAKRILLHEQEKVFEVVVGEGVKRLDDISIVGTSHSTARKIRRAAKRGIEKLTAVSDFSAMPRETQMRHTAAVSTLAVVANFTKETTIKKIEKATENRTDALSIAQTIEAFKS